MRTRMGWLVPLVVLAALAGAPGDPRAASRVAMIVAPGDRAPEIVAMALQGWKFRSDWSQADYTILNFWATWCEPCKTEIPVLEQIHEKHKGKSLSVIGGMMDDAKNEDAQAFLEKIGVTYRVVRIDTATANNWGGLNVLPTTYVIDRQGTVRKRYVGATPEQIERMKSDIDELLAASAAPEGAPKPAPAVPPPAPAPAQPIRKSSSPAPSGR